jgi:acetyl-CoA synthetase
MNQSWKPSEAFIKTTNLFALMHEKNSRTYAEILRWSVDHHDQFVERTLKTLGIHFKKPYEKILDVSAGPRSPQWLSGARLNIAESCFTGDPERTAILIRRQNGKMETITQSELDRQSNRIANALMALDLKQGDAVAIDMPMSAESVMAYLGIVKAGMVVISIPDSLPPEPIALRLKIGDAKAVFTQSEILRAGKSLPLYEKITASGINAPQTIVIPPYGEDLTLPLRAGDIAWDRFMAASDQFEAVACAPQDPTNIIFSSGTTGTPKAIPWDHVTPIKSASDGHYHQDIRVKDVVCWPTNLGWMMGPWLVYASLINKATIALYEGTPSERGFCEFVQDAKVTMLGLVPSIVAGWRNTGVAEGLDWSAIRCFSSSGEASNPDSYSWLMQLNQREGSVKPVVEYCGGTEIGGGYIAGNLVSPLAAAQFNGAAMGSNFTVLNEQGQLCQTGETGEVFLIPPCLGLSVRLHKGDHDAAYHKDCPPNLRRHGDLMTVLGENLWRSNGRAGNDMNLSGIKVGSTEIEQVVNKVPGVLETAAIGVPTAGGGPDQLVVYAVLRPDIESDIAALKAEMQLTIKTSLNPLFHLQDVVVIETLPRTSSNKVIHRELRALYKQSAFNG